MKKKIYISFGVFFALCVASIPLHLEVTKNIVGRQINAFDEERLEGYQVDGQLLIDDLKFHPREYIQIERR
ncbi:hypothetical protein [Alteribacter populi]|uniref:hypothetical protein n=1 Tax=Alteribacter populi TaxID=2011011 RepID=UPI000BBAE004|nr:hypothetical protein [Alteribacter populi]